MDDRTAREGTKAMVTVIARKPGIFDSDAIQKYSADERHEGIDAAASLLIAPCADVTRSRVRL